MDPSARNQNHMAKELVLTNQVNRAKNGACFGIQSVPMGITALDAAFVHQIASTVWKILVKNAPEGTTRERMASL